MDIPGSFLHADMKQDVHMLLEGTIAKMIVKLEPTLYQKLKGKVNKANPCCM